jgi:nucleoside phosphorylase/energy-coupling factor transporter ATP-binding protein EcfA2
MPSSTATAADVAILLVVPEALDAIRKVFGDPTRQERRRGQEWDIWEVPSEDGGSLMVVADETADRSNMPAQEATALMIDAWRPRYFLLADIGGGFGGRDGLRLGDVVVASELEYYSLVKEVSGGGTEERGFAIAEPSRSPRKDIARLDDRHPGWHGSIPFNRPESADGGTPRILAGQIIVGERLLSDPKSPTVRELTERYPKALAVDMESVGAARAVWAAQQQERFTQFGVLRGISDLIAETGRDNQETRDEFKPYAAAAAVAAAYAYIRTLPGEESMLVRAGGGAPVSPAREPPGITEYLDGLRNALARKPERVGPDFRLPLKATDIRVSGSAAPEAGARVERSEVLDIVEQDGLVAIIGKSGAGKSELLNTLARQLAAGDDPVVVPIDLKKGWSPRWAEAMPDQLHGDGLNQSMDALLNAAESRLNIDELNRFIERDVRIILLTDALNEVPPEVATRIRDTLHQYARKHSTVQALVTDRRAEIDYHELHWTVLELSVLEPDEVRRVVDGRFGAGTYDRQPAARRDILGIPFFLDQALRQGRVDFASRADLVEHYLREGGLEEDFRAIGKVALDVLKREETTLSEADQEKLGPETLEKLRDGGFVVETESGLVFSHQLIHQYLAGRHLASDPKLWEPPIMDAITFSTASLDGVGMAVKAIDDAEQRDQFLHRVYDWNWRAAVVALSEARTGDRSVSEATEQAILAMAAEKRFDPVEGTRSRISGLLGTVNCQIAERFRTLAEEDLYKTIAEISHPEIAWWEEWKEVFLAKDRETLHDDRMIEKVSSQDPLIGWMAANALRRAEASREDSRVVQMLYRTHGGGTWNDAAIRWRVIHTLGAWPAEENADLLFTALGDPDRWCRYGAVRSLVEMAAGTEDHGLRDKILGVLMERWRDLDPEPLSQIGWASRYTVADREWPAAVRPLIEAVRDAQQDEERERWNQRLAAFDHYADTHADGTDEP